VGVCGRLGGSGSRECEVDTLEYLLCISRIVGKLMMAVASVELVGVDGTGFMRTVGDC